MIKTIERIKEREGIFLEMNFVCYGTSKLVYRRIVGKPL